LNTERVLYEKTAKNEQGILEYRKGFQWGLWTGVSGWLVTIQWDAYTQAAPGVRTVSSWTGTEPKPFVIVFNDKLQLWKLSWVGS
jgi:hypothetical protein